MSVATLVGTFDDIVRSASVLAEGIEGGLCCDLLFVAFRLSWLLVIPFDSFSFLEFIKFVSQQEECRKKWLAAENEAVRLKQDIAKITVRIRFTFKVVNFP